MGSIQEDAGEVQERAMDSAKPSPGIEGDQDSVSPSPEVVAVGKGEGSRDCIKRRRVVSRKKKTHRIAKRFKPAAVNRDARLELPDFDTKKDKKQQNQPLPRRPLPEMPRIKTTTIDPKGKPHHMYAMQTTTNPGLNPKFAATLRGSGRHNRARSGARATSI